VQSPKDSDLRSAADTKVLLVSDDALERLPAVLERRFPGATAILVADENTHRAAGERAAAALSRRGFPQAPPLILPGKPVLEAAYENVLGVRRHIERAAGGGVVVVPVAVGAGTVNDLVKLASAESGCRYVTVPTAASVDGYAAFGASIIKDGYKQTLSCPAPLAIVADLNVLRDAPLAMSASGYGDLLGKVTAGADWIIADAVGVEPIDPTAWDLVQSELREWIEEPEGLSGGDPQVYARLFRGLTMAGLAMQALRKSRPASGTEHLFSHYWEMRHLTMDGRPVSHGFKVAVGSLVATAFMETLLERSPGCVAPGALCRKWPSRAQREAAVRAAYGVEPMTDGAVRASLAKHIARQDLVRRLEAIRLAWPSIRSRMRSQLLPYGRMRELLERAGCPTRPEQIGLTRRAAVDTLKPAQMFRDRYTVLDLAFELGWLEDCVNEVLAQPEYLA